MCPRTFWTTLVLVEHFSDVLDLAETTYRHKLFIENTDNRQLIRLLYSNCHDLVAQTIYLSNTLSYL